MTFSSYNAIRAYTQTNASGAMGQNPHGLIMMLFQGASLAVAAARTNMQLGLVPKKCAAISKAIAIIDDGLHASLDEDAGGEISQRLGRLYDYMVSLLVQANTTNDAAPLEEVGDLLAQLSSAWGAIATTATTENTPETTAENI